MTPVTSDILAELAPTGRLRAAINFGNPILAKRHPVTQEPTGVSVDLSRELAGLLGVPVDFITYDAAGKVVEALERDEWDVAFVARDPVRGEGIEQTIPYLIIEGAYLVREDSSIGSNNDVDHAGTTVVVGNGSAYDLYLTRTLTHATIVRAATSPAVVETFLAESCDVAAGVRQQLEADAAKTPGLRLLDGRFMVIEQSMGTPKRRQAAAVFVSDFVSAMIESGSVERLLAANQVRGAVPASGRSAR